MTHIAGTYCWAHSHRLNYRKLNELATSNLCDNVFLLVLDYKYTFFDSKVYPSRRINPSLREIAKTLRKHDIHVHAWVITLLRANNDFVFSNMNLYHVSRYGKSIIFHPPLYSNYKWIDPIKPGTISHVLSLIKEILDLALFDSIHLDYIRYPDNPPAPGVARYYGIPSVYSEEYDFGYSTLALKKFNEEHGFDPRATIYGSIEYEIWSKWRADKVKQLVNKIRRLCKTYGVKIGADVFPTPELAYRHVLQKWDEWNLDLFAPMLYHEYWLKPPSWIINTSVKLYSRGLSIVPGIHLNQLSPKNIEYVITSIMEKTHSIAIFVYPPISEFMKHNWRVVYSVLRDLSKR